MGQRLLTVCVTCSTPSMHSTFCPRSHSTSGKTIHFPSMQVCKYARFHINQDLIERIQAGSAPAFPSPLIGNPASSKLLSPCTVAVRFRLVSETGNISL